MDAVTAPARPIRGEGTAEADWLGWPGLAALPTLHAAQLVPPGRRAVVVAPHPDDEVLAVGGLLAQLAGHAREIVLMAVTDGTASHRGSTLWPAARLARHRPLESAAALHRLGVCPSEVLRLGLPDGGLQAHRCALVQQLGALLRPGDVVFTTWRGDGHPDHEATGVASATAATLAGAALVEVPVWAWHWAQPGDARLPWQRAHRIVLDADVARRKRDAVQCFASQLQADPTTGAGPILRASTVARAARPFEVVFT